MIIRYRIFEKGDLIEEVGDITSHWQDDFVTFIIGCSFSFEEAMLNTRIPVRHIEEKKNVPMYNTNIPLVSAGIFRWVDSPPTISDINHYIDISPICNTYRSLQWQFGGINATTFSPRCCPSHGADSALPSCPWRAGAHWGPCECTHLFFAV